MTYFGRVAGLADDAIKSRSRELLKFLDIPAKQSRLVSELRYSRQCVKGRGRAWPGEADRIFSAVVLDADLTLRLTLHTRSGFRGLLGQPARGLSALRPIGVQDFPSAKNAGKVPGWSCLGLPAPPHACACHQAGGDVKITAAAQISCFLYSSKLVPTFSCPALP